MDSDKLNKICGPFPAKGNCTIFHSIADSDCYDIMDRIFNYFEGKDLQHILTLKNANGETCLHTAAKYGHGINTDIMISLMVSLGAELNAQDAKRDTVLHIAVKRQDYELKEGLLSLCVNKDIKNKDGLTVYPIAEQNKKDHKMIEMLLTKGENSLVKS